MGTVTIIPTRAALKSRFEETTAILLTKYDPIQLISAPSSVQQIFMDEAVQLILRDIDDTNPRKDVLKNAARSNIEAVLKTSAMRFERDQSLDSQESIRKKWQQEIPLRINSIESVATYSQKTGQKAQLEIGEVAPLVTKHLLLQRFAESAKPLRAMEIRDFHGFSSRGKEFLLEPIIKRMTDGVVLQKSEEHEIYRTLHDGVLEVSRRLNVPPYNQATKLMADEAIKYKAIIGDRTADLVLSKLRGPKV